jgi:hypothetical protein
LGTQAQDQADRLARVLSNYRKGGVSQSALIRALLEIAVTAAIRSGDPIAALIGTPLEDNRTSEKPGGETTDPFAAKLWGRIRTQVMGP